ncbi:ZIP transporter [Reticulomyxa filosa]|uniref:ZIP transporter n=1 Tax=Reticulomyxa filosa TaxID=46433 RepID=X6MA62_RETFI|nr:ZIP transporter [Reticulomyxa filosa]|eukprot:ETO09895.1 ZIP transporter [Reticulomyxa filosa]
MGDPCSGTKENDYDQSIHVGAIFIILLTSWLGVGFPIFAKHQGWTNIGFALEVGKFFGAGVITATGFVHILPDALETLTDECLPTFWTTTYPAAGGFFALFSALLIHLIEYVSWIFLDAKNRISLYVLECAIAVHSIIIGADLGVAGSEFQTLLIALVFHQFFEGIGLGYRISEINYEHMTTAFANAFVYSITTPTGIAIGIGLHHASSPDSTAGVLTRGILNAMAAGVLVYTSLVTLISEESYPHGSHWILGLIQFHCLFFNFNTKKKKYYPFFFLYSF